MAGSAGFGSNLLRRYAVRLAVVAAIASLRYLTGCGGEATEPAAACGGEITHVAWCECVAMRDGSAKCVALTDVQQFCEPWWADVVEVTASHPLDAQGRCTP